MQINENQWKSMEINGNQWKSMKINENQWKINGNQWKSYQSGALGIQPRTCPKNDKKKSKKIFIKIDHLQLRKSPKNHPCVEGVHSGDPEQSQNAMQIHRESMKINEKQRKSMKINKIHGK